MNNHGIQPSIVEHLLTLLSLSADPETFEEQQKQLCSALGAQYMDTAFQIKKFIDEIPGGFLIYRADEEEKIIYANKALMNIFKCDTHEEFASLTKGSFRGMVHPDDLEEVERSIAEQIENNKDDLDYVEYRITDKNGVIHWVEDYGHYIRCDKTGDVYYVFISDATEKIARRQSERTALLNERLEKEQRLKSLIQEYDKERKLIRQEHLQRLEVIEGLSVNYDSILYANMDTDIVLPYRLSERLEKQFEKKLQERPLGWFLDDYVKTWVHPEDKTMVAERTSANYIRKKLENEKTYYLNYRCVKEGKTQYIQLRIVNVGSDDGISQIVMGYRNIEEELLREIKQKQLLKDALNTARVANVAKNRFMSNMSHDMRTPLNAIFGYAALASKNAGNEKSVRKYLDKIDVASKQILELVDKVLELSYIETQDLHIDEKIGNIIDTANEIYHWTVHQAEKKDIRVTLDTSEVRHADVICDAEKIKQLLVHLTGNAVQYTNSKGNVEIAVRELESSSNDISTFMFTVKDDGIGIGKETLPRIFEPFERESNTTFSGMYGTGLGLTIAKHLTEIMGGDVTVESEVGKGSTFTVTLGLKLCGTSCKLRENSDDPYKLIAGKRILVVEDNEINLEIETEILKELGVIVDSAPDGKVAVEKMQNALPDEYTLILMDIQMPVMDGREATRAIRSIDNPALAKIPIVALSANAYESDKRESIAAGMDAHLTKPLDVGELVNTLAEILRTRR